MGHKSDRTKVSREEKEKMKSKLRWKWMQACHKQRVL